MNIQTKPQPNHISPVRLAIAGTVAGALALAAFIPFVGNGEAPSSSRQFVLAPSFVGATSSEAQRFQLEMDQHEGLTAAVFGPLEVSQESLAAGAIAEHGAHFPAEPGTPAASSAAIARALAEHGALIEPYVS